MVLPRLLVTLALAVHLPILCYGSFTRLDDISSTDAHLLSSRPTQSVGSRLIPGKSTFQRTWLSSSHNPSYHTIAQRRGSRAASLNQRRWQEFHYRPAGHGPIQTTPSPAKAVKRLVKTEISRLTERDSDPASDPQHFHPANSPGPARIAYQPVEHRKRYPDATSVNSQHFNPINSVVPAKVTVQPVNRMKRYFEDTSESKPFRANGGPGPAKLAYPVSDVHARSLDPHKVDTRADPLTHGSDPLANRDEHLRKLRQESPVEVEMMQPSPSLSA